MYTEEYERRGFPFRDFILKLILVIIFVFLLVWLLPKFIAPAITKNINNNLGNNIGNNGKACTSTKCDTSGISALTSQIFSDNIEKMKDAAISYYTDERLPQEVGQSDKMTLSDMIGKKLIIPLIDKNNKACDVEKSYVKITKTDEDYILKVNLKDSEKEDYILVHLGCYTYCDSYLCQKQGTNVPVKGAKDTGYVPIKGAIDRGIYYPPAKPTPVVPVTPTKVYKCVYANGNYYDANGQVVNADQYRDSCVPKEKHYCVYYDGKYYDSNGNIVNAEQYNKSCVPEVKHYCVKYNGKYYDADGKVVSEDDYKKSCVPEEKHYCVKYNGKYYDARGRVVSKAKYKKSCVPEEKHYCVYYDKKYYDKDGNVVSEDEYKKSCGIEDKHYCVYYDGKYYGKNGKVVSEDEYKKQCEGKKEYIYEYKKTIAAKFSAWTSWSGWETTNCSTNEINCSDSDSSCLMKLQILKRKEKIGTYEKTYAKTRDVVKQTGSYKQLACSKYNYVKINNTIYATTTTTTYTQTNVITSKTEHSVGGWVYNGRASYNNPPRDSADTHYKFVGADYSYCGETCTTLPNYYYDSYTYTGGLSSTSITTTPGNVSSSTSSSTTSTTAVTADASCAEYVEKTIPIYGTITVTEKAKRTEPLYGDVCYESTKTRKIISSEHTQTKWSKYNDRTLLDDGWTYTGNKKVK